MGTLYRLIDHKNKLYYDMDKWYVWQEAGANPTTLRTNLLQYKDEEWEKEAVTAILARVSKHMEFPLDVASDGGDTYHDIEDDGYVCCGDRFTSHWGCATPYDEPPTVRGVYCTWDSDNEPYSASRPAPTKRYFDGSSWCAEDNQPMNPQPKLYWMHPDNEFVKG